MGDVTYIEFGWYMVDAHEVQLLKAVMHNENAHWLCLARSSPLVMLLSGALISGHPYGRASEEHKLVIVRGGRLGASMGVPLARPSGDPQ